MAQFRIDNWGGGKSLYIDYDKETHQCYIPEQYTGADYAEGDGIYAADIPTWQGNEALRAAGTTLTMIQRQVSSFCRWLTIAVPVHSAMILSTSSATVSISQTTMST